MTAVERVTEAQRATVACPRSHGVSTVPGLEFKSSDSVRSLERIITFLVIAHDISELPSIILGLAGLAQVPHYEFVVGFVCTHG